MKKNYTEKQLKDMKKDFRKFLYVVFKCLGLPEPTPVQYDIAYKLQHGTRQEIIMAFRGIGKSYITAAFSCWCLWLNPDEKLMVVSAGQDRSDAFSYFVKQILDIVPFLNILKPRSEEGNRDTQNIFDVYGSKVSGSPSIKSVGIRGQLTGSRATIIIADDIEIPSNSMTNDQREKLAESVKQFAAVLSPGGRIIYLGTPQTEMSLYNKMEPRGYKINIWTARVPTEEEALKHGSRLAPFIRDLMEKQDPGTSIEPLRFSDEELKMKELEYGKSGFAMQFMLDTSLSDANRYPLKINDLIIYDVKDKAPEEIYWTNNPLMKLDNLPNVALEGQTFYSYESVSTHLDDFQYTIMTIDPSGRGEDETSYAVGKMHNGNIYIPQLGGLQGGYSEAVLSELANIAKKHKVDKIIIESNFGDGMFTQLFTPYLMKIYQTSLEEVRHSTQKELRIIGALEPVMNQHRLIISPSVIQQDYDSAVATYPGEKASHYMLFHQMARISKDKGSLKHDDRLDSLAQVVLSFNELLAMDQELQKKARQEDMIDQQLVDFMDECRDTQDMRHPKDEILLWQRSKRS